jgi:NTP pyrophosphatase (non-canonical NTP hydrolase)
MESTQLQNMIAATRETRGFTTDPVKLCVLLTEEVGELASEIKRTWSANYDDTTTEKLSEECADVFVVLAAIANAFGINLENAIRDKFFAKDAGRLWATQGSPEPKQKRDR